MFSKQSLKSEKSKSLFGENPGLIDMLIVVILCFAAFIFFDQWYDMNATSQQASDLLDCIFTGKPLSFYTFVLNKAAAGGYMPQGYSPDVNPSAAYNVVLYFVLAIWELPMYIANHLIAIKNYAILLELWARLLSILLSFICGLQMTKLAELLMTDKTKAKWVGYYFISSPLIIYCVIIRNQLDMVSVLLIVLALKKYFQKKLIAFCLLMSIACCFKLMPIFIVIPLLLFAEKKVLNLIRYLLLSISLYAITTISSILADPGYTITQNNVMKDDSFSNYIFKIVIPGGVSDSSAFLVIFFLICVLAYIIKPKENDSAVCAVLLGFSALSSFFLLIKWHPQWIVLLLPFVTLLVFSLADFNFGVLLDVALTFGFLLTSILIHLTAMVFDSSIFYAITSDHYSSEDNFNPIYSYFYNHNYSSIVPSTLFFAGIVSLLLVVFINLHRRRNDNFNPFDNNYKISRGLLYARSFMILVCILPPVISYLSHPIA